MNEDLDKIVRAYFGALYAKKYSPDKITSKNIFEPVIAKSIETKRGLRFHGVIGSGKTMLLINCVEKLQERLGIDFHNRVSIYHEQQLYELIKNKRTLVYKDVMIIDDFGSVKIPEWLLSDYEYIYARIHSKDITLYLSTNLTEQIIEKTYPRTYSRLKEITDGYIVPGEDRRKDK